ncbi:unnamed protein product [Rhizophagus irregularis]|nr:unnamed protein product [Rhizophagus irregularis]
MTTWTRYFLESLPRDIIRSKAQQLSVSADVHHLSMMISENKENDRKSHKLDDDGGGVDGGVRSIGMKDNEGIGAFL